MCEIRYISDVFAATPIVVYTSPFTNPNNVPPTITILKVGNRKIGRIVNAIIYIIGAKHYIFS